MTVGRSAEAQINIKKCLFFFKVSRTVFFQKYSFGVIEKNVLLPMN